MEDNSQKQQPEDIIRQDYEVRVAGGQKLVIPKAFQGLGLPLAYTHKPDYSMALDMPGGVSKDFQSWLAISSCFLTPLSFIPTRYPTPNISLIVAWANHKVV
jgi:hypothetical protein